MSWELDTNNAECDGCGYKELSIPNPEKAEYWHNESRFNSLGVKEDFLLCGSCHNKYRKHMAHEDDRYNVFMKGLVK